MSESTHPTLLPERLRDQAISALIPFFLNGPGSDVHDAYVIAAGLLDDYQPATPKELQLATQIIALGWAVLACLRTSVAAKNLSLNEKLTMQESAIALERSSQKAAKALEARRKERAKNPAAMKVENINWDEGAFQLTINQALDKLVNANTKFAAYMATLSSDTSSPGVAAPVIKKPKLPFTMAEPMTPSVLARRAKH